MISPSTSIKIFTKSRKSWKLEYIYTEKSFLCNKRQKDFYVILGKEKRRRSIPQKKMGGGWARLWQKIGKENHQIKSNINTQMGSDSDCQTNFCFESQFPTVFSLYFPKNALWSEFRWIFDAFGNSESTIHFIFHDQISENSELWDSTTKSLASNWLHANWWVFFSYLKWSFRILAITRRVNHWIIVRLT